MKKKMTIKYFNMKKIWILILPVLLIIACNENSKEKEQARETRDSTTQVLSPEKGKWKLDANTRENITGIKAVVADSNTVKKNGYPSLAANLQPKLDTLLSECKMTGEDHEALHRWLEGFINDMKGLKSKEKAEEAYVSLKNDLYQFDQSFE